MLSQQIGKAARKLTQDNFETTALVFEDRQAGVSLGYDPKNEHYFYVVYCAEKVLLKELYSCEFEYLEDALDLVNTEFGTWRKEALVVEEGGCTSCSAKT